MTVTVKNLFGELITVGIGEDTKTPACDHGRSLVSLKDCPECEEKWEDSREQMRLVWLEHSEWTVIR